MDTSQVPRAHRARARAIFDRLEEIDGAGTKTLSANTMMVACTVGSDWLTVGGVDAASTSKAGIVQLVDSISSTSQTLAPTANAVRVAYDTGVYGQTLANNAQSSANSAWNNAESRVSKDCGAFNVGSLCLAKNTWASSVSPGGTLGGSKLSPSNAAGNAAATALSGTWRALGNGISGSVTLWQRIS